MAEAEGFEIERVLGRTFTIGLSHPVSFLAVGAVTCLPALAVDFSVTADMKRFGSFTAAAIGGYLWRYLGDWLMRNAIWTVCAALMAGPVTIISHQYQTRKKADITPSVVAGLKQFFPMLAIAAIHTVCVLLGLAALLAPGFLLMCIWIVVTPARVIEGRKILGAFGRSRALAKGHRGKIFLLVLMFFLLEVMLGYVLRMMAGANFLANADAMSSGYVVAQWLIQMLFYLFSYILAVATYYELGFIKDGIGSEETLAAFD